MTYCLAIKLEAGIVYCSDTRTTAGIDQVSAYSKMHDFSIENDRHIMLLSAGNLATSQAVISKLQTDIESNAVLNLHNAYSSQDVANYVALSLREEVSKFNSSNHEASMILGVQLANETRPQIMLIYPQGNFITTSNDTPFLQIGESKYGKPILDRVVEQTTTLSIAAAAAIVSMDSTIRSNVSVGAPIELCIYKESSFARCFYSKFTEDSAFLRDFQSSWDTGIKKAFNNLPPVEWSEVWETKTTN